MFSLMLCKAILDWRILPHYACAKACRGSLEDARVLAHCPDTGKKNHPHISSQHYEV